MNLVKKEIMFNEDKILTCISNGKVYISVRDICNNLKMTRGQIMTQIQKVQRDETLNRGCMKIHAGVFDENNETLGIELEYLTIWLVKINPSRFDEQLKQKLLEYQLYCKDILANEFFGKRKTITNDKNFNQYNDESRERLDEADSLEEKLRKLCVKIIHEYDCIDWRTRLSKDRIKKIYEMLKGKKITIDGKELSFKDINELNKDALERIEKGLLKDK